MDRLEIVIICSYAKPLTYKDGGDVCCKTKIIEPLCVENMEEICIQVEEMKCEVGYRNTIQDHEPSFLDHELVRMYYARLPSRMHLPRTRATYFQEEVVPHSAAHDHAH